MGSKLQSDFQEHVSVEGGDIPDSSGPFSQGGSPDRNGDWRASIEFFSVREGPIGCSLRLWPAPLKDSRGSHCQGCSTCPYYRKGDGPEAAGLDKVWKDWRDAGVMRRRPGGPHDALIAIQISVTLGGSVVTAENAALLLKSRLK